MISDMRRLMLLAESEVKETLAEEGTNGISRNQLAEVIRVALQNQAMKIAEESKGLNFWQASKKFDTAKLADAVLHFIQTGQHLPITEGLRSLMTTGLIGMLAKEGGSWNEAPPSERGVHAYTGVYPEDGLKVRAQFTDNGVWGVVITKNPGGAEVWSEEGKFNLQPFEAAFAAKVSEVINNARRAQRRRRA